MKNGVTPKWENVAHNKNLATEVSFMTLACVWRMEGPMSGVNTLSGHHSCSCQYEFTLSFGFMLCSFHPKYGGGGVTRSTFYTYS